MLKTNLEAVKEIVRQIRLRDLGGIIVVDFIDMEEQENRALGVARRWRTSCKSDRSKTKMLQISDFGLVEITRKRVKPEPGAHALPALPRLRRHGPGQVDRDHLLRHPARTAQDRVDATRAARVVLRVHPTSPRPWRRASAMSSRSWNRPSASPSGIQADPNLHVEHYDVHDLGSTELPRPARKAFPIPDHPGYNL